MSHTTINLAIQNLRVQLTDQQQQKATMALCALPAEPLSVSIHAHDPQTLPPSSTLHRPLKIPLQSVANSFRYAEDTALELTQAAPSQPQPTAPLVNAVASPAEPPHAHNTLSPPPSSTLHHLPKALPQSVEYSVSYTNETERHNALEILHDHRHMQQRERWKTGFIAMSTRSLDTSIATDSLHMQLADWRHRLDETRQVSASIILQLQSIQQQLQDATSASAAASVAEPVHAKLINVANAPLPPAPPQPSNEDALLAQATAWNTQSNPVQATASTPANPSAPH